MKERYVTIIKKKKCEEIEKNEKKMKGMNERNERYIPFIPLISFHSSVYWDRSEAVLALPKMARSILTHKSISFI